MKELIKELRSLSLSLFTPDAFAVNKAADALEKLTSGDVELPEPCVYEGNDDAPTGYTKDQLLDYGNRRAAQAAQDLAELESDYADQVLRAMDAEAKRLPMTKEQVNTMLSAHYKMDPTSSDMGDEDWVEVLSIIAAVELFHGIKP